YLRCMVGRASSSDARTAARIARQSSGLNVAIQNERRSPFSGRTHNAPAPAATSPRQAFSVRMPESARRLERERVDAPQQHARGLASVEQAFSIGHLGAHETGV